ncbi:hypothetical protein KY346_00475 [Candidatus Woesearchaeota archaeon]|nr:hypothetical protein [Candidatus Woesearchaeota archaeon]
MAEEELTLQEINGIIAGLQTEILKIRENIIKLEERKRKVTRFAVEGGKKKDISEGKKFTAKAIALQAKISKNIKQKEALISRKEAEIRSLEERKRKLLKQ